MKGMVYSNLQQPIGNGEGQISPADWINLVIEYAAGEDASDIHFDVGFNTFVARIRVDGVLEIISEQANEFYEMVISRLKIMSVLNTNERRMPQEGHAFLKSRNLDLGTVDLRVSIFPTVYGESAVLRILNRKEFIFNDFEEMGMSPSDAETMRAMIHKPNGMILLTGPSGCGKSATLYTALKQIQSKEKNIITLEDPVEYQMEFTRQSQINDEIDYTFAKGMRSILRQDPDVIMVGEIRDTETAEIAIRAALAGRLLFSTLHTNGTVDAIMRFLEFNIPKSFIATALRMVVAKRLVRLNCTECVEQYTPGARALQEAGIANGQTQFFRGKGCPNCNDTGFKGRTGIYEFFIIDKDIQDLILSNATFSTVVGAAQQKGMRMLRQSAIELAVAGKTTLEEGLYITA